MLAVTSLARDLLGPRGGRSAELVWFRAAAAGDATDATARAVLPKHDRARRRGSTSRRLLPSATCWPTGIIFAAFISYLSTAQQIFQEQYRLGKLFPVFFGMLAAAIGVASFVNGRLVMHFGMQRLSRLALLSQARCRRSPSSGHGSGTATHRSRP